MFLRKDELSSSAIAKLPAQGVSTLVNLTGAAQNDGTSNDVWIKRLEGFKSVQNKLLSHSRAKAVSGSLVMLCAAVGLFSLSSLITINEYAVLALTITFGLSSVSYLVTAIFCIFITKQRDYIKIQFFESNHELEAVEQKLSLVERGSNKVVAAISL
ncbi:hypothetical protein [uncultured Paraglaciecola sp.]|uniref:hypothetical protein n=1 Tax=uncultured Paraglaciecola sp. TaxID=1765024 RepID=UPI0025972511|nr:hypothetical protein [uncultured Paraglaciecola sp.]